MAFLSNILNRHFTASRGVQGIQGTSNSTQGVQGIQGVQGLAGLNNGTLITNTQSGSYTLQASDVGEVVSGVSTVGIPSDVFKPGENIVILNNDLSRTILNIEGKNPAVSIYEAGVGVALTENRKIRNKSFISLFCTRLNEFILGGSLFKPFIEATGGTVIDSDGYRIHVFTGTAPFNVSFIGPPSYNTVEYVVVAGGGGVGPVANGGGGAGGFRTGTNFPVTIQDYTITVGGGGPVGAGGNNSVFSTITSSGGGLGAGGNGGSGGGGGTPSGTGGLGNRLTGTTTPAPTQGNNGGTGNGPTLSGEGGGGGGAGAVGSPSPGAVGGAGGNGTPVTWVPSSYGTESPLGPGRWFAGGGGGNGGPSGGAGSPGGAGGGGAGSPPSPKNGTPGTTNTGGGGGAGNSTGGSGIVIIRYPIT